MFPLSVGTPPQGNPGSAAGEGGDTRFITARNEVWGKVIFSQACVKNSVHRGVPGPGVPAPGGVPSPGGGLPGPGGVGVPGGDPPDGYCCGRYASYWNNSCSDRY